MEIWFPGILLSAIASVVIVLILLRQKPGKVEKNLEIQVFNQRLEDIERQHKEGLISSNELAQAKTELGRKILNSDKKFQNSTIEQNLQSGRHTFILATIVFLTLVVGSQLIHNYLGSPGYSDQPIKKRIDVSQALKENRLSHDEYLNTLGDIAEEEKEFLDTIKRLEQVKSQSQEDYQNLLRILIQTSLVEEKLYLASQLYNHLVSFLGEKVSLDDLISQVELMIYSAQLYVSPETEIVILDILDRDPKNLQARFYLGLMYEQVARPDLAFEIWSAILVDNTDSESPLVDYIKSNIGEIAQQAGINLL